MNTAVGAQPGKCPERNRRANYRVHFGLNGHSSAIQFQ
jgi:hypothetical protein